MNQGELWLTKLPTSNGREQSGERPALIIADTPTKICIVVPLTSNLKALKFPYTCGIQPSSQNGLKTESIALIFHIRSIDKDRLVNKIGAIEKEKMSSINEIIRKLLSFD